MLLVLLMAAVLAGQWVATETDWQLVPGWGRAALLN